VGKAAAGPLRGAVTDQPYCGGAQDQPLTRHHSTADAHPRRAQCPPDTYQAAQVNLVSDDATAHEDSALSVDVDVAYALAQRTGLLPDYDKCRAYIADVHSAFRSGS
jgi:hypothetical protein